jgi:hypothetical protein
MAVIRHVKIVRELHRAQKPRKVMPSAKPLKPPAQLAVPLHGLFRGPPKTLAGHLQRISAGISIWQEILRARLARHSDFRSRYLAEAIARELVRGEGRQRLRVPQLDTPPLPQRPPAALLLVLLPVSLGCSCLWPPNRLHQ